jgi:negative regulator of flagellin synthesis FlgM
MTDTLVGNRTQAGDTMAIEISGLSGRAVQDGMDPSAIAGPQPRQGTVGSTGAAGASSDRVSLTSSATLLQDLEKEVAAMPVVVAQRVEAVQLSLATGTHEIDPVRTADKLIELELALGGKG